MSPGELVVPWTPRVVVCFGQRENVAFLSLPPKLARDLGAGRLEDRMARPQPSDFGGYAADAGTPSKK